MRRKWTQTEIDYLKDSYCKFTNAELVKVLGRNPDAIQNKAAKLGIELKGRRVAKYQSKEWSVDEIAKLREIGSKYPAYRVAAEMGRSFSAIHHKMRVLKIAGWRPLKGKKTRTRDYNAWSWTKIQVGKRDKYTCRICAYYKHVNVHHILAVKDGGTDELSNLITLCPNHHAEADMNEIPKEFLFSLIEYGKSDTSE